MDTHVDQVADRLARLAAGLHESAAQLARWDAVVWSSLAADRYRELLAEAAGRARVAAERTEHAAEAMSRHAEAARRARDHVLVRPLW